MLPAFRASKNDYGPLWFTRHRRKEICVPSIFGDGHSRKTFIESCVLWRESRFHHTGRINIQQQECASRNRQTQKQDFHERLGSRLGMNIHEPIPLEQSADEFAQSISNPDGNHISPPEINSSEDGNANKDQGKEPSFIPIFGIRHFVKSIHCADQNGRPKTTQFDAQSLCKKTEVKKIFNGRSRIENETVDACGKRACKKVLVIERVGIAACPQAPSRIRLMIKRQSHWSVFHNRDVNMICSFQRASSRVRALSIHRIILFAFSMPDD